MMYPGRWWHPGRFGAIGPRFGRRRIPVRLEAAGGEP